MSLLGVSELSFEYPSGPVLFENVSFPVNPADRVAIVGPNGSGKSTLLRLIAGDLAPTRGRIIRQRALRVAVADQEIQPGLHLTLFEFVFSALPLAELRADLQQLEQRLSDPASASEYAARINEYQDQGGFLAEAAVTRTLSGLGYSEQDQDRDVQSLSGGERTRAALARALSLQADLLVLDEPTNHLDIAARGWLEASLASRAAACVITSHDRALLSAFASRIVEIERSKVSIFENSYLEYRRARTLLDREAWLAYEASERRKEALNQAAHRRQQLSARVAATPHGVRGGKDHYARKAAKVARTARILKERVSEELRVEKPWEEQPMEGLTFDSVSRSGDVVVAAAKLTKSFGSKTLFRDLSFHVRRGDRLAILGPNGSGKTTLLNIIQRTEVPDSGSVRFGAKVELASLAQDSCAVDLNLSPLEICGSSTAARTLLACLRLRPDRLNRPLRELSGGERTKVALARILSSGANLLLLDEPTNHLEIEAQEALEQALESYPGTVIIVSHDRFFLDALGPEVETLTLPAVASQSIFIGSKLT
ncbi:MAG TPA: ABC-F family ATP-binding cassette domain-containing protein [Bryobacteraceae bacterium]|nr:ABC-F family ATP-binding cassette domain-containing protein [Bryobacteraceae bacterium]